MDYNGLVLGLQNMHVTPPDILRASLYYYYLEAAQTYFTVTLNAPAPAGLTAPGYAFVQNALTGGSLLNQLAKILDFYVAPAVEADLQAQYANGHGPGSAAPWTYRQYFDNMILNVNPATYNANVAAFRLRYPISGNALIRLDANFRINIKTCCERVFADRLSLVLFLNDLYSNTLTLNALTSIKSSGSDFHKGGQQVLILGLSGSYRDGGAIAPTATAFKLVYKPGDLEADCLIAGISSAVNAVTPGFMVQSLYEIYNAALAANPGIPGLALPTYRILPRNYNSQHGGGAPLPIRNAYGYIQYLNYDLEWNGTEIFGFYPYAVSDYVVFASQPESVITDFYRRAGAFCALACSFSIVDMHIENFRVSRYNPYPIDLELSLTASVPGIASTSLTGNLGGLTADSVYGQESHWVVRNENVPGGSYLERDYPTVYEANRLYQAGSNQTLTLVPIDSPHLFAGYDEGMQVLRAAQTAGNFNAWFTRLDNVVVRYLPFPTSIFKQVISQVYINTLLGAAPGSALIPTLTDELLARVTQYYNTYHAPDNPIFLAFQFAICGVDYQNLDIPVFYYRILAGSRDIVDSSGVIVPIPVTVAITGNPAAPCAAVVGRATFFAADPMTTNVQVPQVDILSVPLSYQARFQALQQSMLVALGLNAVPAIPQNVMPDFYL